MLGNYISDKYSENYNGGNDHNGGVEIGIDTSHSLFCWAMLMFMVLGLFYVWKFVVSPMLFSKSNYISHLDGRSFMDEGIVSKNSDMKQSQTQRGSSGITY